jgi:hypothetical protein
VITSHAREANATPGQIVAKKLNAPIKHAYA